MEEFERERKSLVRKSRRVVVKIGSSALTAGTRNLSRKIVFGLADDIARVRKSGREVILVTSGAIASGTGKLRLKGRPRTIPEKQAAAAVGQVQVMNLYIEAFARHKIRVAQILLTHADLADRTRFLNARAAVQTLLRLKVLPIVNENDTVAVEEIKFGDNDNLAAHLTNLVKADFLVILSDIDGLFSADPRKNKDARLVPVLLLGEEKARLAGLGKANPLGTGGIKSKIEAATRATRFGVPVVIANGLKPRTLQKVMAGETVGTFCPPQSRRLQGRKSWIAYNLKPAGAIVVDQGAETAIREKGKSLLPSGIVGVEGRFQIGSSIRILNEKRQEFARGLTAYGSEEVKKIGGHNTQDIERILGYKYRDEVIHRDDLVII
jgi:glutamate 5-kinase